MVVKYDGYHHRTNSPVSTSAIRTSGASSKNSAVIIIRMIIEGKPEDVAQHIHASELPLHLNGCTHPKILAQLAVSMLVRPLLGPRGGGYGCQMGLGSHLDLFE